MVDEPTANAFRSMFSAPFVEPLSDESQKKAVVDFMGILDCLADIEKQVAREQEESQAAAGIVGWVCPVCGRGLSPVQQTCPCWNPANNPFNFPPPEPWWKPHFPHWVPPNPWPYYRNTWTTCYC